MSSERTVQNGLVDLNQLYVYDHQWGSQKSSKGKVLDNF